MFNTYPGPPPPSREVQEAAFKASGMFLLLAFIVGLVLFLI